MDNEVVCQVWSLPDSLDDHSLSLTVYVKGVSPFAKEGGNMKQGVIREKRSWRSWKFQNAYLGVRKPRGEVALLWISQHHPPPCGGSPTSKLILETIFVNIFMVKIINTGAQAKQEFDCLNIFYIRSSYHSYFTILFLFENPFCITMNNEYIFQDCQWKYWL